MFNTQLLGCLSVISKEVKLLALVLAGWSASQERVDSEVEPRAQSPAIAAARMRECASLPGYRRTVPGNSPDPKKKEKIS